MDARDNLWSDIHLTQLHSRVILQTPVQIVSLQEKESIVQFMYTKHVY